jgi:hypothetical protein
MEGFSIGTVALFVGKGVIEKLFPIIFFCSIIKKLIKSPQRKVK